MDIRSAVNAAGLSREQRDTLQELIAVFIEHQPKNRLLSRYYDGDIDVKSIGVDSIPDAIKDKINLSCDWPNKAVTALANRSRFDGYVLPGIGNDETLEAVVKSSHVISAYSRNIVSQLKHGVMFAAVGVTDGAPFIRFHSAENGAAVWDDTAERISAGFVQANFKRTDYSHGKRIPTTVILYLPYETVTIQRTGRDTWRARSDSTLIARPMLEAFRFAPTGDEPLGTSRISKPVRDLTDDVLRVRLNMAVSGELFAAPQKYLLGLSDEQFDVLSKSKWNTYVGSVLLTTTDGNGNHPDFGQLNPVSPQPYIDMIRADAMLFSGVTGVPLNSLGIVQDNPSSAEAINAANAELCLAAEKLNEQNRESLQAVAVMAMAAAENKPIEELSDVQRAVEAHFKPANTPSLAATADAAVKIASVREGFARQPVFLEMIGFDEATIDRIESYEERQNGLQTVRQLLTGANTLTTQTAPQNAPESPSDANAAILDEIGGE